MEPILFLLLAMTFVAIGVYMNHVQQQRRIAELRGFGASLGWQFSRHDPFGLVARWSGPPFGRGRGRHVENVLSGEARGRLAVVFDYRYTESEGSGSNRRTTTYRFTVCALRMPAPLPGLMVGPESFLSRLGNALGLDDIELESEAFNRAYKVRCPDAKLAFDVLHPRTMEWLLHCPPLQFRFEGVDVLTWVDGKASPGEITARIGAISAVLDGVPAFVWKDYGGLADRPSA